MSKTSCLKSFLLTLTILLGCTSFATDSTFFFTTSDSVRLHVRVAGQGKPCVFVHGGPGSTSYYFEAFPAATLLQQHMQLVYFDQRGSGRSDAAASNNYSLDRLIQDMEELRTALNHASWSVMGHSFGGIISTAYAARHPKTVSALYMIHGTVNMQTSMRSHLEFGLKELDLKDQSAFQDASKPLHERVSAVHDQLSAKNLWHKLMFRNAAEKIINDSVTFSIARFNRDFASKVWSIPDYWQDFTPTTKQVTCPVLVITGETDYAIGPKHYLDFRYPQQTVVHYIGGHASFQEEPQWFAEKVLAFAARHI